MTAKFRDFYRGVHHSISMTSESTLNFVFELEKNVAHIHRMLQQAFIYQALSQARTYEWFKRLKGDRESVGDDLYVKLYYNTDDRLFMTFVKPQNHHM